jgi:hypothetical protein
VLKAQDLVLKAISPGIRIKFEPGIDIDVHNPEPGEDRALAKIRISDPDPDKKGAELSRICDQLKKKTRGVAAIYPYKVSKDTPAAFVYDVIIDLSASPVFHETVMSADAGKLKVRSSSKLKFPGFHHAARRNRLVKNEFTSLFRGSGKSIAKLLSNAALVTSLLTSEKAKWRRPPTA